jgi:transcriptional regulator with XRE-family HTH domain
MEARTRNAGRTRECGQVRHTGEHRCTYKPEHFGRELYYILRNYFPNMSDAKLSATIGVSAGTITSWKRGYTNGPTVKTICRIATILNMRAGELVEGILQGKAEEMVRRDGPQRELEFRQ